MRRYVLFILAAAACTSGPSLNRPRPRAAAELGKKLFFDARLSAGSKMSCATCHQPARAFTNGERVARGVHGDDGERNVPTLLNRGGTGIQFWDGRAASLEDQVAVVITSSHEMGASFPEVSAALAADPEYPALFKKAFGRPDIDPRAIARALAAYERTLHAGPSAYDRYQAGDKKALTAAQMRGMNLFFQEYKCVTCHSGPNFSDEALRPRCYPATNNLNQFMPIHIEKEKWVKTPTLRNLKYTAPYMHNGTLNTLEQVVDFYAPSFQASGPDRLPDTSLPVVRIDRRQRKDLVEFLKALSADTPYTEVFDEATAF
jgi:cytochrome c peroxidase